MFVLVTQCARKQSAGQIQGRVETFGLVFRNAWAFGNKRLQVDNEPTLVYRRIQNVAGIGKQAAADVHTVFFDDR